MIRSFIPLSIAASLSLLSTKRIHNYYSPTYDDINTSTTRSRDKSTLEKKSSGIGDKYSSINFLNHSYDHQGQEVRLHNNTEFYQVIGNPSNYAATGKKGGKRDLAIIILPDTFGWNHSGIRNVADYFASKHGCRAIIPKLSGSIENEISAESVRRVSEENRIMEFNTRTEREILRIRERERLEEEAKVRDALDFYSNINRLNEEKSSKEKVSEEQEKKNELDFFHSSSLGSYMKNIAYEKNLKPKLVSIVNYLKHHENVDRAIIIGFSWGGWAATNFLTSEDIDNLVKNEEEMVNIGSSSFVSSKSSPKFDILGGILLHPSLHLEERIYGGSLIQLFNRIKRPLLLLTTRNEKQDYRNLIDFLSYKFPSCDFLDYKNMQSDFLISKLEKSDVVDNEKNLESYRNLQNEEAFNYIHNFIELHYSRTLSDLNKNFHRNGFSKESSRSFKEDYAKYLKDDSYFDNYVEGMKKKGKELWDRGTETLKETFDSGEKGEVSEDTMSLKKKFNENLSSIESNVTENLDDMNRLASDKLNKWKKTAEDTYSDWSKSVSSRENNEEVKSTGGGLKNWRKKDNYENRSDIEGSLPLFKYDDIPKEKFDGFSPSVKSFFLSRDSSKSTNKGRELKDYDYLHEKNEDIPKNKYEGHWSYLDEDDAVRTQKAYWKMKEDEGLTKYSQEKSFDYDGTKRRRKFE